VGRSDLVKDDRFASPASRLKHHRELTSIFQEAFLARDSAEWIRKFQSAGVPVGPIQTVGDVLDRDPHVTAREMVVEVNHPTVGSMKTLGVPVKLSETPGAVRRAAPLLGEHTREILAELGFPTAEVMDLLKRGVIRTSDPEPGSEGQTHEP